MAHETVLLVLLLAFSGVTAQGKTLMTNACAL